jgi:hypothetical protein
MQEFVRAFTLANRSRAAAGQSAARRESQPRLRRKRSRVDAHF